MVQDFHTAAHVDSQASILLPAEMSRYELEIPEFLHAKDQLKDNNFNINEEIYRRFKLHEWISEENIVSASAFSLSSDSFNRQKYSKKPEDVLLDVKNFSKDLLCDGILKIIIGNLYQLNDLKINLFDLIHEQRTCSVSVEVSHAPHKFMYAHSDVIFCVDEIPITGKFKFKPNTLKTIYKGKMQKIAQIIKQPGKESDMSYLLV